jgi:hypothetical protein
MLSLSFGQRDDTEDGKFRPSLALAIASVPAQQGTTDT